MVRIKLKNSQVKDKVPQPADLDVGGELGVNHHADNPGIFLKDTAGNIRKIAGPNSISTSAATEAAAGVVELATIAETAAGTDNSRAVHPAGLKALLVASLTPGSTTPPATPAVGTTYLDSSVVPAVITVWNGTAWVPQTGTATKGGTAPATPATGQLWLDTSSSPAASRIWDGTNWIALTVDTGTQAKIDQQVAALWSRTGTVVSPTTAGDDVFTTGAVKVGGTSAAPNIQVKADGGIVANTNGLVYDAATKRLGVGTTSVSFGKLVISKGGAEGIEIEPGDSSNVNVIQHYNRSGTAWVSCLNNAAAHIFTINGGGNEKARIDSSGRLLVGTSTARNTFDNTYAPRLQVEGEDATQSVSVTINAGSKEGGYLLLGKSRGASPGSNVIVQSGDRLGVIVFQGADGTKLVRGAEIVSLADSTPGPNAMPARLSFFTTPIDANAAPIERMRIGSDGSVSFGNTQVLATAPAFRMVVKASGIVNLAITPTYADNTAAKAGGLVAGDVYRTATGQLMITF